MKTDRALRGVLGAVFFAAGALKIADPRTFALSLAQLGVPLFGPVAILLPWVEVVAAVALFVPKHREASLRLIVVLLAVFGAVLAAGLAGGRADSCGCFGSGAGILNRADVGLGRNLILLVPSLLLLRRRPTCPAGPASPA